MPQRALRTHAGRGADDEFVVGVVGVGLGWSRSARSVCCRQKSESSLPSLTVSEELLPSPQGAPSEKDRWSDAFLPW